MSAPPLSPPLDPYGKPLYQTLSNQVPHLPMGQYPQHTSSSPVVSLWKEQVLALVTGAALLILGTLGISAFFSRGPLFNLFIPIDNFRGVIVNGPNLGSLVAGIALVLSIIGGVVLAGVSRAWLRRRAVGGFGPSIRQWRTISAGASFDNARGTPLLAGGLFIAFTLVLAVQSSALPGVLLPTVRDFETKSHYYTVIPYIGNGGSGLRTSCINQTAICAQFLMVSSILEAFRFGSERISSTSIYQFQFTNVASSAGFVSGALPPQAPGPFRLAKWVTPMSQFTTTCNIIADEGSDPISYYVNSPCYRARQYYGNASQPTGTYTYADQCDNPDGTGVLMNIAMGGAMLQGNRRSYAVSCNVGAVEGFGDGYFETQNFNTTLVARGAGFVRMPAKDLRNIGSALLAGFKSDFSLEGFPTATQTYISIAINSSAPTTYFEHAVSNAFAASATAGYTLLVGGGPGYTRGTYPNTIPDLNLDVYREGYGWESSPRILGWSTLCLLSGVLWCALALYMFGGGTRYNPTDWYHTLNTAAGSTLVQGPGTCTTAHLRSREINNERLWYGELYPGHLGFSHTPVTQLQVTEKYGRKQA